MNNTLSIAAARRMILHSQLLDGPIVPFGGKGAAACLLHLGYVQIDSISVLQRAHHHTLWTRVPDYHPNMLHDLQIAGHVFEYWAHAMSYVPMVDYRYYLPRIEWFNTPTHYWFKQRQELYERYTVDVLERLRQEGPLSSADFERQPGDKTGPWFEHKAAKGALELLFWRGDIMVKERRHFQKIYDLTERILPGDIDTTFPTEHEWGTFFVRRALRALGIAREKDIFNYIETTDNAVLSRCLQELVEDGTVIKIHVDEVRDACYLLADRLDISPKTQISNNLYILSPFDNLAISRDRLKNFFNFDYTLECYTPPAKRQFGYFALPILYGDTFIGKMDARAARKDRTLVINNLAVDYDEKDVLIALAHKLADLAQFNQCTQIQFIASNHISKTLQKLITLE